MKYSYFPGCTLKTTGKELDRTARLAALALGFELEEVKAPVMFSIDKNTWQRNAVKSDTETADAYFLNFGSNKYRLKLTDYQ